MNTPTAQRFLTGHKTSPDSTELNGMINISVIDNPGSGGANHQYDIDIIGGAPDSGGTTTRIRFQDGPVKEAGFNGISNEALLEILIDRLRGFQSGPYKCRENAIALTYLEEAQMWLMARTRDRLARGVEGTHTV